MTIAPNSAFFVTTERSFMTLLTFFAFTSLVYVSTANALTIRKTESGLSLEGEIVQSSPRVFAVSLAAFLFEMHARGDRNSLIELHLNIPKGGTSDASFHLVELMKAAQTHGTKFAAHVGNEATCMSGCTYLFLAANERWIAPNGKLIFHGFSQAGPQRPASIPHNYFKTYRELLKSTNQQFYNFFKAARIIEDNKLVGFTGSTLVKQSAFSGLITGLINE